MVTTSVVRKKGLVEGGETEHVIGLGVPFNNGTCVARDHTLNRVSNDLGIGVKALVSYGIPARVGCGVDEALFHKSIL